MHIYLLDLTSLSNYKGVLLLSKDIFSFLDSATEALVTLSWFLILNILIYLLMSYVEPQHFIHCLGKNNNKKAVLTFLLSR